MGHPMYCPVCDDYFDIQLKCMSYSGGTIDSCGDANSDLQLYADCPDCGFKVVAIFDYNANFSNQLMKEANADTHEPVFVPVMKSERKWMTKADAAQYFKDEGLE